MSTLYKSVGFNLTTTDRTTVYTCPEETETIMKSIQTVNYGGSNVDLEIFVNKSGTDYDIAHHTIGSKVSLNAVDSTIVLEEGLSFKPISISPEQAQFLSSRQFSIEEVARIFNVPPHLLKD